MMIDRPQTVTTQYRATRRIAITRQRSGAETLCGSIMRPARTLPVGKPSSRCSVYREPNQAHILTLNPTNRSTCWTARRASQSVSKPSTAHPGHLSTSRGTLATPSTCGLKQFACSISTRLPARASSPRSEENPLKRGPCRPALNEIRHLTAVACGERTEKRNPITRVRGRTEEGWHEKHASPGTRTG